MVVQICPCCSAGTLDSMSNGEDEWQQCSVCEVRVFKDKDCCQKGSVSSKDT